MKFRWTKVDAGDFKHELLNRLRSTMAVNVLKYTRVLVVKNWTKMMIDRLAWHDLVEKLKTHRGM